MKYKIRINPAVIADVQEIITYIAKDNPEAASIIALVASNMNGWYIGGKA